MKSEECEDCFQYKHPGPSSSFFTGDKVDVIFIFISPTRITISRGESLGPLLKESMKRIGLTSYGLTNAWKCMLDGSAKHAGNGECNLHPYCLKVLTGEINTHRPLLLVSMGTAVMETVTFYPYNVYKYPGRVGIADRLGDYPLMPMMHPSNQEILKRWMNEWNEGFSKLKEVLLNGISI